MPTLKLLAIICFKMLDRDKNAFDSLYRRFQTNLALVSITFGGIWFVRTSGTNSIHYVNMQRMSVKALESWIVNKSVTPLSKVIPDIISADIRRLGQYHISQHISTPFPPSSLAVERLSRIDMDWERSYR